MQISQVYPLGGVTGEVICFLLAKAGSFKVTELSVSASSPFNLEEKCQIQVGSSCVPCFKLWQEEFCSMPPASSMRGSGSGTKNSWKQFFIGYYNGHGALYSECQGGASICLFFFILYN